MKKCERIFSTTKNDDSLTERKHLGEQIGGLLKGIAAQEEHDQHSTWSMSFQFFLIIWQPLFLIRILKAKIGRNEFRLGWPSAMETGGKRQNKERDYYDRKNLYPFQSFLHL
jgi:hypothetical protein